MKKTFLVLLILIIPLFVYTQELDTTIVLIKKPKYEHYELYKGSGVIFPKDKIKWEFDDQLARFTPTIDDIIKAELIFFKQYNLLRMRDKWAYYFDITTSVRKKFMHWNRQYVGYINKEGDKIIVIQLLDFRNKHLSHKLFRDWKEEFIVISDSYKYINLYYVNIDKVKLFQK